MATRTEKDSLGEKQVADEAYYGIQTQRALENFPISGQRLHPLFWKAQVLIKKAAALANREVGLLEEKLSSAIVKAADEALEGKFDKHFVVDAFQAGAGTSQNMNVNEVLANRALEHLGFQRGDYKQCSPNDHVNMGQSTNDTIPTAIRLGGLLLLREFYPALEGLRDAFAAKGREFDGILKSGRTHLQDAVPIRLGQEFTAYARTLDYCLGHVREAARSLEDMPIGGSAVGTGLNTLPGYREKLVDHLSAFTGLPLRPAPDMREAMQSHRPAVMVSSTLRALALELGRIASDLRLLASGPNTGFYEIELPAVQPGSSIMPGKVNPVMAECTNMVCFQVVGNDTALSMCAQAGQLELNVMMPTIAYNLMMSLEILKNLMSALTTFCIGGIKAIPERCQRYAESTMGIATALNTYIGYMAAAEVAKESLKTGKTLTEIVLERGLLTEAELKRILDPVAMTEIGVPGRQTAGSR
ncbi:MAG TPA: aspartate ammonia-lyase [Candidatus Xenobia bacterium]